MNSNSKMCIKNGGDIVANVMKNVIMKFQCNLVTHFQVTSTLKNCNQKLQPENNELRIPHNPKKVNCELEIKNFIENGGGYSSNYKHLQKL